MSLTSYFLGGTKIAVLKELAQPCALLIDNKQLLIKDLINQLHVYSMRTFKYERQLFKLGEGPTEATCLAFVWLSPNYVYLYCNGKNSFFSRDGKFVKEFRTASARTSYIRPVEDKYLIETYKRSRDTGLSFDISIYRYTPEKVMKPEKTLYCWVHPSMVWKGNKKPLTIIKEVRDVCVYGDRIFIGDSQRGLFVQIHDMDGNRLNQVRLESEKIKVPNDYSTEFFKEMKETGKMDLFNNEFYYDQPDYFPAFYRFYIGENKIYFLTYNRIGDNREVIICDWKGNSKRKAYVPWVAFGDFKNCTIWNDKFYWLVDNQDTEEWELHAADVK